MHALQVLVENAKNGEKDAFRRIFDQLHQRVFMYAAARTPSREDALDVTQDTFVELWTALRKFRYASDEAFYGFVFTIAKRKLYRYYQSEKELPAGDNIAAYVAQKQPAEMKINDNRHLLRHMDSLARHYRDVLKLRYWSGMSFAEIASTLQINESTARVRHNRALKLLKVTLNKHGHA